MVEDQDQGGAPRALIVDDIEDNRNILRRRLERKNFVVAEAVNGLEALDAIAREQFDIVLMDVMMPEMDGIEALRTIRQTYGKGSLPVIMVTAKRQTEDIVSALEFGANDYITKPVDFPVALARINTQLSRKKAEQKSDAAHRQLELLNRQLDDKILQRTSRLEAINTELSQEIKRRQQSEVKSYYLAYHDSLTGLANRVLFREQVDKYLHECRGEEMPVAVLGIDLDGFKSVNDTLGHSAGDDLLKVVAAMLRDHVSEFDSVARLGGDEFAILRVGERQPDDCKALANRIIESLSKPVQLGSHEVSIGASIGIVVDPECSSDSETLLKSADLAMYRAKRSGRGTYRLFDLQMEAEVLARRKMEQDLRLALRRGEFTVFYQPLVDLKSGRIASFEALLRWKHPELGNVPPGDFVKVAEEIGLIASIGDWVLRQACQDASKWPLDIRVAVNLSPIQFLRGSLVSSVVSALATTGLDPNRLDLEITESVMLEKTAQNLRVLRQLRELGVKISMDDFGTGYSSLSYLRDFRFDKIKIDQSFIRKLTEDAGDLAIVRTILALGHSFGIRTTAEGVETQAQATCLIAEGCTEVQGHLYSKPVGVAEVNGLLSKYNGVN